MDLLTYFEKQSKFFIVAVGFTLIGLTGMIDFLTGYELSLSVFYAIPISLITWFTTRQFGLLASLASAFVWLVSDIGSRHPYSYPLIPIWNSLIRLAFFVIITLLLSSLRNSKERESELARVDYLTGAANLRLFFELMQMELDHFERHGRPFTLTYFDLDNFKSMNDQFGHLIGDNVLRTVVSSARKHLRKTDVIARLGGDEFALLLPETNQASARIFLSRIQNKLLEEMRQNNWPTTFSFGALTCSKMPDTIDELVRMADELMYSAKRDGKNVIKYSTYTG